MTYTPQHGFYCTRNQGFSIVFPNGYTVSVQFGGNNYCSMRNVNEKYDEWRKGSQMYHSPDAEVAILDPNGEFVPFESSGEKIRGRTDAETVAKIIQWAASLT